MFGVFTFSLTHFLAKIIFSRGIGGVQNSSGKERLGVILVVKNWKFWGGGGGGGGGLREIPSVVGVWYFLELHNYLLLFLLNNYSG